MVFKFNDEFADGIFNSMVMYRYKSVDDTNYKTFHGR